METVNFSNLESQVLSSFNEGNKTFDLLLSHNSINEKTLNNVLEGLISKNILRLNNKNNEYEYQKALDKDIIVLDGNLLLPTTIIKTADKMLVSRGEWYEFPVDFDIRRIVWNVKLNQTTNSTLVDLIKSSVLKEKKSKIEQLPEYQNLVNKIIPYSPNIGLLIHCVGESITDISIIFKIKLGGDISVEHRGFTVRSEIETELMIEELRKPVDERNYDNIKLNHIFNLSDFIFSKNEIPMSITDDKLIFVKITSIKKVLELTYFSFDTNGQTKRIDSETFDSVGEGIDKIRELFNSSLAQTLIAKNNFLTEMSE
jgi:predicted transcriptional regulator